jgi:hypothetical protein
MSDTSKYQVINGTYYAIGTPLKVVDVLERARQNKTRIVIDLGFTESNERSTPETLGQSWMETFDTTGYVGRSMGPIKVPLLIPNSRSHGGGQISTTSIVRILTSKGKHVLYEHPNYHKNLENA